MDTELDKAMDILMCKNAKGLPPQLSQQHKQMLTNAYLDLFFGLAGTNWARDGKTLGGAWYRALQQIEGLMGAKNKSNPAAMYLNQIFAAERAKWSQIVMTHPQKDTVMELSQSAKQKWTSLRAKQVGNAMADIDVIIQFYKKQGAEQHQAPSAPAIPNNIVTAIAAGQNEKTL